MPHHRRLGALALLFTAVTVGTCVYPTERDSSVHVSITPLQILIRGNDTVATATAWQMRGPTDSVAIPNVAFVWTSSDPKIATVDNAGHITGVKSGTVNIRAAAANFDKGALPGQTILRVSAPLEVDSVRPQTVTYGETATVYGVGAANLFFLPAANKLKARIHQDVVVQELLLEGVGSIVEGMNPRLIRIKLEAFLQSPTGKDSKKGAEVEEATQAAEAEG